MMQNNVLRKINGHPSDAIILGFLALLAGIGLGLAVLWVDNPLLLAVPIVGALVLLLVLRDVETGLLALVFMTYTRLSDVLIDQLNMPSLAKLFVPFLIGIVLLRWWVYKERPGGWQKAGFLLGIYGFVLAASSYYALDPGLTQIGVENYLKDALIALLVVALLKDGQVFRRVIWMLLAAGIFLGSLTTFQILTGTYDQSYGGFALASVSHIVGEVNDYRVQGPLSSNYYALILVFLVPLAMDRLWQEKSIWLRFLAGWALAVSVLSILFTFSRGGFLALVVVIGLMLLRHPPRPSLIAASLIVFLVLLPFIPAQYTQRVGTLLDLLPTQDGFQLEEGALRGRLSELTVAGLIFLDHPLGGVGYNNFEIHYLDYSPALGLDPRREGRAAHNLYAEVAAETGLIGLAAFGLILYSALRGLRQAYRVYRQTGLSDYASLTVAFSIGLLGILTGSLFLHGAYPRYFWLILGIALALPGAAGSDRTRVHQETSEI
jgi:putative inorganic carbon (hco3(-)) transporter